MHAGGCSGPQLALRQQPERHKPVLARPLLYRGRVKTDTIPTSGAACNALQPLRHVAGMTQLIMPQLRQIALGSPLGVGGQALCPGPLPAI